MDLLADDLSGHASWVSLALYIVVLVIAARGANWSRLRNSADSNIWLAVCACIFMTWSLRASVDPGLHLHFLGGALMALMFGWHFAILGGALVVLGLTLWGHGDWLSFGANALLMSVIPVSVTYLIFLLAEWKLPKNYFIYIFISAFLGGGLSMVSAAVAINWFLQTVGSIDPSVLNRGYFQFNLLIAFPEGFTTGFLMSVFVIYRPEWVFTFRDSKYLHGK